MTRAVVVRAEWDDEAAVWVANSRDLRGLVTEAPSFDELRAKLPGMILDLLEEEGSVDPDVSVEIVAWNSLRFPN
jgi:predicted RNase H-like HicB family nuclease